jgi:phosphodiesterase/alkaline phosphatase D-like protein
MTATAQSTSSPSEPQLLGPFLGYVTPHSIMIWLHLEGERRTIYVSLHAEKVDAPQVTAGVLNLRPEKLFADCITIDGLRPDTRYFYKLWTNPAHSVPLDAFGLLGGALFTFIVGSMGAKFVVRRNLRKQRLRITA